MKMSKKTVSWIFFALLITQLNTSFAENYLTPISVPLKDITYRGYQLEPDTLLYKDIQLVLLHGWLPDNSHAARYYLSDAKNFADLGFNSMVFSMRGWPETRGVDDCGYQQAKDVVQLITWLKQQPELKTKRIGLVGYSQGGQVALLSAAQSTKIDFVIGFFPVTDINLWQQTSNFKGITDDYIPSTCSRHPGSKIKSPINYVKDIKAPVLLIHGDKDLRVPTEQSISMATAMHSYGKSVRLEIIPDAMHGDFNEQQNQQAFAAIIDFLNKEMN